MTPLEVHMAVSAFADNVADRNFADINVTPLVDVMLVLLIIFMVAAPTLSHELNLRLPQPNPDVTKPPPRVSLQVQADGSLQFDGQLIGRDDLRTQLAAIAQRTPRTVLEIRTDADADYQDFARALAVARNSGITNIATQ